MDTVHLYSQPSANTMLHSSGSRGDLGTRREERSDSLSIKQKYLHLDRLFIASVHFKLLEMLNVCISILHNRKQAYNNIALFLQNIKREKNGQKTDGWHESCMIYIILPCNSHYLTFNPKKTTVRWVHTVCEIFGWVFPWQNYCHAPCAEPQHTV